jgi:hypothetical protein
LEILNLPSIPDGDEYIQSLNYISGRIADRYQLGESDNIDEGETNERD